MKNIEIHEMNKEDYRYCITKMVNKIGNKSMLRKLFLFTQVYYLSEEAALEESEVQYEND